MSEENARLRALVGALDDPTVVRGVTPPARSFEALVDSIVQFSGMADQEPEPEEYFYERDKLGGDDDDAED